MSTSESNGQQSPCPGGITPALVDWQQDEQGNVVPVSRQFGDVYYSMVDGLAESRYVFIQQNQLPERFATLFQQGGAGVQGNRPFTIAELGFGTGLNLLATWQLWRQVKAEFCTDVKMTPPYWCAPRLHIISTEKYPLTRDDLLRSLSSWQRAEPELQPLIEQLLDLYPSLIEGCHRLHLDADVTLDLWLGDATSSLGKLDSSHGAYIDAWYLDGFAPACNESLWAEQIFAQVARLSQVGTTAATFSCAGMVKRGLTAAGFTLKKVKGFGRKREMLTAQYQACATKITETSKDRSYLDSTYTSNPESATRCIPQVCVIGAGVSGLMSAWSLAQRGIKVQLLDKVAPLAGASGNPRGLLAPKMTPISHVAEHLHTIGYLYSRRLYQSLDLANATTSSSGEKNTAIFEPVGALDLLTKANVTVAQIAKYPDEMATTLTNTAAKTLSGLYDQDLTDNLYLPQAGLVNPQALADKVLSHPLITFKQSHITRIESDADQVILYSQANENDEEKEKPLTSNVVIIAAAYDSCRLDEKIFDFRKIRGQLSWFIPNSEQIAALPKLPLKYGGYCAPFVPQVGDERLNPVTPNAPHFLLGASFVRNDMDQASRPSEHEFNRDKLIAAVAELEGAIAKTTQTWRARVGIRAQTPDYHPLVGPLGVEAEDSNNQSIDNSHLSRKVWTISGMGSKGYAFAPICAETLADLLTGSFPPLSATMIQRLSPSRSQLKTALTPNK